MSTLKPRVDFYVDVDDPLLFACRLLNKVFQNKQRALAYGAGEWVDELDMRLWTFEQGSFLPHTRADDALAPDTPVLLSSLPLPNPGVQCLLNLDQAPMQHWESYPRILEIVGHTEAEKQHARKRYRLYRDAGCELHNHPRS